MSYQALEQLRQLSRLTGLAGELVLNRQKLETQLELLWGEKEAVFGAGRRALLLKAELVKGKCLNCFN